MDRVGSEVASLEALAAAIERREAAEEEDDLEAALDQLIRELVHEEPAALSDEEFMREDEFACRGCHLVLHRSRLADRRRVLCSECAARRRGS